MFLLEYFYSYVHYKSNAPSLVLLRNAKLSVPQQTISSIHNSKKAFHQLSNLNREHKRENFPHSDHIKQLFLITSLGPLVIIALTTRAVITTPTRGEIALDKHLESWKRVVECKRAICRGAAVPRIIPAAGLLLLEPVNVIQTARPLQSRTATRRYNSRTRDILKI